MRADYDFHPDESAARVFTTPAPGVLRLDDDVAITEVVESGGSSSPLCLRRPLVQDQRDNRLAGRTGRDWRAPPTLCLQL